MGTFKFLTSNLFMRIIMISYAEQENEAANGHMGTTWVQQLEYTAGPGAGNSCCPTAVVA